MKKLILVSVVLCSTAFAGCSTQSPAAPGAAFGGVDDAGAKPPPAATGIYALSFASFVQGTLQEVTSLPVQSAELILKAYVTGSTGSPAGGGTVTFEYCSYKGGPPNDINRPDEAPKEACEQGTASWARLTSVPIDHGTCAGVGAGYACMNFGVVRLPRDVGFRFRYASQGSGVPSGTSASKNFTWTAGS